MNKFPIIWECKDRKKFKNKWSPGVFFRGNSGQARPWAKPTSLKAISTEIPLVGGYCPSALSESWRRKIRNSLNLNLLIMCQFVKFVVLENHG